MIQATQLKRGMCIKHDNDLYWVVEAQHKTPGNLRGMVQAKIRNLKSGSISDHRFRSVDMVERAILDDTEMEFLYQDGDMFHFMNNETYEQIGLWTRCWARRCRTSSPTSSSRCRCTRAGPSASTCRSRSR